MKTNRLLAVLLTAMFLAPLFAPTARAGEAAAFSIDTRRVLPGMKRSYLQGYQPTVSRNVMTLLLPVASPSARGAVQAEIILQSEQLSPFPLQSMTAVAQRPEDGVWPLRFTLRLHEDRANGDYAAVIRVTGQDEQGQTLRADLPYVFRIRDGAPSTEALLMQIDNVQADFRLGENGLLTATLTNPCQSVAFERPVLRVSDGAGDILPQSAGALYLDDLAPGESATVAFPMTVLPTASVSPHILTLTLSWTALGQEVAQSESYTLPVTEELKLEQGGLKLPASVVAGDSVSLSLPLMNMSRTDLINVTATLSLPGIVDRQSVLVGTITPGETKTAQLAITPGRGVSGEFTGTLDVAGTDRDGNAVAFSLPVALDVEPPAPVIPADAPPEEAKPPLLLYLLAGGCAALLILCVVQSVVLRGKIRRLEEERL